MADYAKGRGITLLLTAHTADDQAETLLMRLARGSGLDGLSAMAPLTRRAGREAQLWIARPLLAVSKARLRATLVQRGVVWIEDPSNASPAFERVRLRTARDQLEALGLTADMLTLSARRLQRARAAVERWADDFCNPADANVVVDPCGVIRIARRPLQDLPEEVAMRVLSRAIAAAGGLDDPVPYPRLEAIVSDLKGDWTDASQALGCTLARAKITPVTAQDHVLIEREPGREPLPVMEVAPGMQRIWDGRFRVGAEMRTQGRYQVRALGIEGLRRLEKQGAIPARGPPNALRFLPAFWDGDALVAVPPVRFWSSEAHKGLSATFLGMRFSATPTGAGAEF
jgi:tRNA(Ile)-lysidine synthase